MKKFLLSSVVFFSVGLVGCANNAAAEEPTGSTVESVDTVKNVPAITEADVAAAQADWAESIVAIGKASLESKEAAREEAENVLDTLYNYGNGTVLFKPTKASEVPFRSTKDEALSYFVGGDIEEDTGFALEPWTNVRFENHGTILNGDNAVASGVYYFTSGETEEEVRVEYTFGYIQDEDGNLRINVHHSSLPF
ncbi:hypothetical protein D920_00157 [Enterococcus faecalis 13-SD-W-01]|nr:hypothetical protein D920_00157 [Enterococcus faecalis 13-SD-W-01]